MILTLLAAVPVFGSTPVASAEPSDPFTFVVIPDTQNYSYSERHGTIAQQAQWVVDQRDALDIAFVAQVGDLVSNWDSGSQWPRVSTGLKILDDAGVPNSVLPGNHDFDNTTGASPLYDQYFPPSRYVGAAWTPTTARYGGYLGQNLFGTDPINRQNMNSFSLFSAGGRDFLVLNLEWEAPGYALDWGRKVLAAHPNRIAILSTHSFLTLQGTRKTSAERPGGTSQAGLWNDFVSQQCSIALVVAGHEHDGDLGESRRTDQNRCGKPVVQAMSNYQDRANGGDGWLRYYTFSPADNTISARTYSPKLGRYETDDNSQFTLPFELSTVSSPPPPSAVVSDTFTRTLSTGFGAADTGQSWSTSGSAASYSVSGGLGRTSVPVGGSRSATLPTVSVLDPRVSVEMTATPAGTGSGLYTSVLGRVVGADSYRAKLKILPSGALRLSVIRFLGSVETTLSSTALGAVATAGQPLRLDLQVSGTTPTTIRAKAWPLSASEPTNWQVTATDSSVALQRAGGAGLYNYLSGTATAAAAIAFDGFTVRDVGVATPPPPPPPPPPTDVLATDAFGRTVTGGWGAADTGGNWSVAGTASRYSVAGGTGVMAISTPGTSTDASIGTISSTATELRADLAWNRTASAGTLYSSLVVRRVTATSDYRAKVVVAANGRLQLQLVRRVNGAETTLAAAVVGTFVQSPGTRYTVAVQAVGTGPTTLRAKLWPVGGTEPGWLLTTQDGATGLQAAGGIGVVSYESSSATAPVTMTVDELRVQRVVL
ncbi:metallophosphoesterase [Planctomonas psychrotolerans]|uniref:metallophosphoesterase n=1 Tax=Planctomonas psychrotolerans TaxID=2528712 RepID=UPI001D0D676A|nr:metallophosphoesterase [Planctomonas psychrotolerans]